MKQKKDDNKTNTNATKKDANHTNSTDNKTDTHKNKTGNTTKVPSPLELLI